MSYRMSLSPDVISKINTSTPLRATSATPQLATTSKRMERLYDQSTKEGYVVDEGELSLFDSQSKQLEKK